ncbi:sensor histidine kinase [Phenylobacterium aquaticum]|uniref:sensor histidine kinase n=1 Tax=Phenylobacterium aquaticum TaxID=1763816 RepID=UPI001F5C6D3E|nr:ATP-binding protein [Phenylobacterium aquaticum]MCI3131636.1 ATP-binding protein [Phenylobacterium aquaticum]
MNGRSEFQPASETVPTEGLDIALLRAAQRNNLPTMVVQIAASIGVVVAAYHTNSTWYSTWLAIVLTLAVARLGIHRNLGQLLRRTPSAPPGQIRAWGKAHSAGLVISAGLWALLAWLRLPAEDLETRFVIIIILSALSGGAIGVLAPLKITGRAYVSLLLLPACARMLMMGGAMTLLGVLGAVFWGVMMVGHRNNRAILVRSIELGQENLSLVGQLRVHAEEVEAINLSLEQRVAERTAELEALAVQAQAANRAKSEFLATISHEIRTPLNGVLGMAQVMENTGLNPDQAGHLAVIRSSAQMLLSVVNDVLDISKIEAGQMTLAPAAFQLDQFADGLRRLYSALANDRGLDFSLTLHDLAPGPRLGDEVRLRQILSNLVSNALKFTEDGGVRVVIRADAERATFAVHDTGIGIAPADQPQVFEKFVQADGSNTRRAGGTGLGLAICRDLTALMGGEVTLASAPGVGSTFTVSIPLPVLTATSAEPTQAPAPAPPPRVTGRACWSSTTTPPTAWCCRPCCSSSASTRDGQ